MAVSALRTPHHSVGIGLPKPVPMAAHPSNPMSRISDDQRVVWDVLGHHGTRSDERVTSNVDSANDCGIRTNSTAALQARGLVQGVAVHLRPRIRNIRQ